VPLYEYECERCGHKFDRMMKMDDPNPPCPKVIMVTEDTQAEGGTKVNDWECGGPTKKLISRGSFHLKGGGWYKDGY
jgi:predicted nucleic acid-binding Zn ribbon protein